MFRQICTYGRCVCIHLSMFVYILADFMYPAYVWPVCVACCMGGAYNVVYAFGFGYGLAMTANGVMGYIHFDPTRFKDNWSVVTRYSHIVGYASYGVRLFSFLLQRHLSESYTTKAADMQQKSDKMTLGSKLFISLFVGSLMSLYHAGLYYHLNSKKSPTFVTYCGILLWMTGLAIETVSDQQKLTAKQYDPNSFVSTGLYSYCRHPNYLGEMMYHVGMFLNAAPSCQTWLEVLMSAAAPGAMTWVMFGATKGLESRQLAKYGKDMAYIAYKADTPSLFPRFF